MPDCNNKIKYPDFGTAYSAILKITDSEKQGIDNKKPVRAYYCGFCSSWHLTSEKGNPSQQDTYRLHTLKYQIEELTSKNMRLEQTEMNYFQKIVLLEMELKKAKKYHDGAEAMIAELRTQIEARETGISNLKKELADYRQLSKDAIREAKEKEYVKALKENISSMEKRLKVVNGNNSDLICRNVQLMNKIESYEKNQTNK